MKTKSLLLVVSASVAALSVACGGGGGDASVGTKTPASVGTGAAPATVVSDDAQKQFNDALDMFAGHDKANDWSDDACATTAKAFQGAASKNPGGKFPEALYNAGLSYARCGDDKNAKAQFQTALQQEPKFHYARAELALYQYKADGNEDAAIGALQQSVLDAQFQNVPALVNLAMFQMQRDSATAGDRCKDDFECAKLNLQRALAIDDAYMPAFNQLALYYFQTAKKRAGSVKLSGKSKGRSVTTNAALGKRADVQQLELAALVCSQAIRKNSNYAPIHNTAGLIQNELGQVNSAVAEFKTAAGL
ncbi:MAG TPA: hypothetical protein VF407_17410, partial [Polyangiaceae bacterium]